MYDYICLKCGHKVLQTEAEYNRQAIQDNYSFALYDLTEAIYRKGDWKAGFLPVYFSNDELRRILGTGNYSGNSFKPISITFLDFTKSVQKYLYIKDYETLTYNDVEEFLDVVNSQDDFTTAAASTGAPAVSDEFSGVDFGSGSSSGGNEASISATTDEFGDVDFGSGSASDTANTDAEHTAPPVPQITKAKPEDTKAYKLLIPDGSNQVRQVGDAANKQDLLTPVLNLYQQIHDAFKETDVSGQHVRAFEIKIKLDHPEEVSDDIVYEFRKDQTQFPEEVKRCFDPQNEDRRYGMICSNPTCRIDDSDPQYMQAMPIFQYAWKHRHIAVGFIGRPAAGKTCLITGLQDYLSREKNIRDGMFMGNRKTHQNTEKCFSDFRQHKKLQKSDIDGMSAFNLTFFYKDTILTLVDIAGECFRYNNGTFDTMNARKHFAMIEHCVAYVVCLDPKLDTDTNLMDQMPASIGSFINHLKQNQMDSVPFYLTVTKADAYDNLQPAPAPMGIEWIYPCYRKFHSVLEANFKSFINILKKRVYYTGGICSAYGGSPKPAGDPLLSLDTLLIGEVGDKLYICSDGTYVVGHYDTIREINGHPIVKVLDRESIHSGKIRINDKVILSDKSPEGEEYDLWNDEFWNADVLITSETNASLNLDPKPIISGSIYLASAYGNDKYDSTKRHLEELCDWIFMVTGLASIKTLKLNTHGTVNYVRAAKPDTGEEYETPATVECMMKSDDRWDYNNYDIAKIYLSDCAVQLFQNYRSFDRFLMKNRNMQVNLATAAFHLKFPGMRQQFLKRIEREFPTT